MACNKPLPGHARKNSGLNWHVPREAGGLLVSDTGKITRESQAVRQ